MAQQRELAYEHSRLEGFLQQAEREKLTAQQEATASANRANAAQKELELEKSKHRKTRDDYFKLKSAEKLIKTTSVHELRKKTTELGELQRRLTKLAASKDLSVSSSLSWGPSGPLITKIDTDGGGRMGLLEFDLKAAREQNNLLQTENSRLRDYLGLYEQQLIDLISDISDHQNLQNIDLDSLLYHVDEVIDNEDQFINASTCNALVPLPTIYKRLSVVTYRLRDRVIEIRNRLQASQNRVDEMNSLVEQQKIQSQEDQRSLRLNFERETECLKSSLKEAQAIIEGWAHTELVHGFMPASKLEGLANDQSFQRVEPDPPSRIEALTGERHKLAHEAIELAKQKADIEMQRLDEERQKILAELNINTSLEPHAPDENMDLGAPSIDAVEKNPEADHTLESLVVYTKSTSKNTTKKASVINTGKPKSSIAKGLGPVHRVKQAHPPVLPRSSKPATTRNRTAVLRSVLSLTGEEGKINGKPAADGTTSSSGKREPVLLPQSQNRNDSSSSLSRTNASLTRNKLNLGKSNSRITRPSHRRL